MLHRTLRSKSSLHPRMLATLAFVVSLPLLSNNSVTNVDPSLRELLASSENVSENEGMELFQGPLEEAFALAEALNKMVFVSVCTMRSGPCIVMQETVFPIADVGEYFNPRFVNLSLDMENEDQNGPETGARYEIVVVPTYLILDAEGNEIGRATGGASPSQLIEIISRVLGDFESTFADMQARYDSGERSTEFVQNYLMGAIVELAFREIDSQDSDSERAYLDEEQKYKKIANEYFASRPYSKLINETDFRLVMYFHEHSSRGDEIVEFVIEHYDEFLAESSESAMAQFALNATLGGVADAARAGDEKFIDYIDALETKPLKRAVMHERNRYPQSLLLPENLKFAYEGTYLIAREDWDGVAELYKGRIEKWGDKATAGLYQRAAQRLLQSDNPTHHKTALDYASRAYEMNKKHIMGVTIYISALARHEKLDEAREIAQEFRSGLTDSTSDQRNLQIFNRVTSTILDEVPTDSEESQR